MTFNPIVVDFVGDKTSKSRSFYARKAWHVLKTKVSNATSNGFDRITMVKNNFGIVAEPFCR